MTDKDKIKKVLELIENQAYQPTMNKPIVLGDIKRILTK